jgi:large subunit ribosomal protein L29
MKYIDINTKSQQELKDMLKEKKVLLFELKTKLKTMQLTNTSELRVAKKDIAKIKTAISAVSTKVKD